MSDPITRLNAALEGHYRIEREVGAGGMAIVFLAEDLKHERQVAIKVLKPEIADAVGADRFLAEIKTTANLQHPHILPLHDSGEAEGIVFYVMPYVEGESLRDRLTREHQLPVEEAVRLATEIADALDYAHRQGVVHRDIKPANILLHEGKPLVADFGIALATSAVGSGRLTETGLSLGTPVYMSPEQATGDQHVGAPSDTYSLGCVLYEMLVGEPPFAGATPAAILGKIVTGDAPSTAAQRKTVPPNVDAAIVRALEKVPADRFRSVADFGAALADASFRYGPGGGPGTGVSDTWRKSTLGSALVAVVASVLAVTGWLRPEPPQLVSRYPLAQSQQEEFLSNHGPSLALSPDGARFAYTGTVGDTAPIVWLKEHDEAHARIIPGTEWVQQVFFFPDGDRLGFLTAEPGNRRAVRLVQLGNGEVVTLADSAFFRNGASASPEGGVYLSAPHRGLARLSESRGTFEPVTTPVPPEYYHIFPEVLPNGRGLLFTVAFGSSDLEGAQVAVLDLESGERRVLVEDAVLGKYAATGHLLFVRLDGTLWAAPFDESDLRLTGEAVPLLGGVLVGNVLGGEFGVDLALSETGTLVYTTRETVDGEARTLQWVTRAGGAEDIDPTWREEFESVKLSPDGSRLAVTVGFGEETDVWIQDLEVGIHTPLTFTEGMNRRPQWMPDGTTVSYITDRGENRDVYGRRADGFGLAEPLFDRDIHVDEAVWSKDGQWLVYRTGISELDRDIYAWRVGTDPASAITVSAIPGVDEVSPTLSPDGRFIAYSSDERAPGVQQDIWVRPFPSVEDGKWQISTEGGTEPLWAPNGAELFYVSGGPNLVSVPVQTTPTFRRGEESVLFPLDPYYGSALHRGYDVTADGQRFVMIREADADTGIEIIVVENFFEELRERVGG
jgi:serine/threonine protein kinase